MKEFRDINFVASICHPIVPEKGVILNNTLVQSEQSVLELTDIGGLSRGERHSISDVTAGETAHFNSVSEKREVLRSSCERPDAAGSIMVDTRSREVTDPDLREKCGSTPPPQLSCLHYCGSTPRMEFHSFLVDDETPIALDQTH